MKKSKTQKLRESFNLTREQFAAKLGVSYWTVYLWETRPERKPSSLAQRQLDALQAKNPKWDEPKYCTCRANGCYVPHDECTCGCAKAIAI